MRPGVNGTAGQSEEIRSSPYVRAIDILKQRDVVSKDRGTESNRAGEPANGVQEERRQTERVPLHLKGASCLVDPGYIEFAIFDLSAAGIGLLSDRYLEPGRRMRVNFNYVIGAEIEVIYCELADPDEERGESRYRIGGRFTHGAFDEEMFSLVKRIVAE